MRNIVQARLKSVNIRLKNSLKEPLKMVWWDFKSRLINMDQRISGPGSKSLEKLDTGLCFFQMQDLGSTKIGLIRILFTFVLLV